MIPAITSSTVVMSQNSAAAIIATTNLATITAERCGVVRNVVVAVWW